MDVLSAPEQGRTELPCAMTGSALHALRRSTLMSNDTEQECTVEHSACPRAAPCCRHWSSAARRRVCRTLPAPRSRPLSRTRPLSSPHGARASARRGAARRRMGTSGPARAAAAAAAARAGQQCGCSWRCLPRVRGWAGPRLSGGMTCGRHWRVTRWGCCIQRSHAAAQQGPSARGLQSGHDGALYLLSPYVHAVR